MLDDFFFNQESLGFPGDLLNELRPSFEENILAILTTKNEDGHIARLIFSGFGADQEYPSLIPVCVNGGYDFRVKYHYKEDDIVNISDKRPVAICPFAQADVIKSILRGIHQDWSQMAVGLLQDMISSDSSDIFHFGSVPVGFREKLEEIEINDLHDEFIKEGLKLCDKTQKE